MPLTGRVIGLNCWKWEGSLLTFLMEMLQMATHHNLPQWTKSFTSKQTNNKCKTQKLYTPAWVPLVPMWERNQRAHLSSPGCKVMDSFKYLFYIYLYACEYLRVRYHLCVWRPLKAWGEHGRLGTKLGCWEPNSGLIPPHTPSSKVSQPLRHLSSPLRAELCPLIQPVLFNQETQFISVAETT